MLLPKQLRTFPPSMQQPGQWAAHLIRVDIPVACYTCTETLAQIYQRKKVVEQKKEGGREGRKQGGRQEERNEGLAPKCCMHFPMYTCYFQRVAGPKQLAKVGFKMWQTTVQFTDVCRNTLQTPCHVVQSADDNFKMLRIPSTCRFEFQKVVKIASN